MEGVSRYRWMILGLALLAQMCCSMLGQSLGPLAPLFQRDLGLSTGETGLFIAAAYTGGISVMLITGPLVDRYGAGRAMAFSLMGTALLLVSLSAAGGALVAALLLFVAGAVRSPVFTASTKAIMDWFPPTSRATAMGLKQTGAPVAGIFLAVALPALGLAVGWRAAFAVVGVVMFAGGATIAVLYRDPPGRARIRERWAGLGAGLRDVLRNRALWVLGGTGFIFAISQQGTMMYFVLYFHDVVLVPTVPDERARIMAAGGYLAVFQFGGVLGRILWGVMSDRVLRGRRATTLAFAGALGGVMAMVLANPPQPAPTWLLAAIAFATGANVLGWNGVYHAAVAETAGKKFAATSVGLCLTISETGITLGPPLFGLVADLAGTYRVAWYMVAGLSLAGTVVTLLAARASGPRVDPGRTIAETERVR